MGHAHPIVRLLGVRDSRVRKPFYLKQFTRAVAFAVIAISISDPYGPPVTQLTDVPRRASNAPRGWRKLQYRMLVEHHRSFTNVHLQQDGAG